MTMASQRIHSANRLTGAFAFHEFKIASPTCRLPIRAGTHLRIQAGIDKASAMATGLKNGTVDPTALADVNAQVASIESSAQSAGVTVTEQNPSAVQLATDSTGN